MTKGNTKWIHLGCREKYGRVNKISPCMSIFACLPMRDDPRVLTSICLEAHIASRCHSKSIPVIEGQMFFISLAKPGRCKVFNNPVVETRAEMENAQILNAKYLLYIKYQSAMCKKIRGKYFFITLCCLFKGG